MKALLRVEAWCAGVVERAFARAFPGVLEPVQIARRLVATIERDPPRREGGVATRYVVRLSSIDFGRLGSERVLLEQQWARMAAVLSERAGRVLAVPPVVELTEDRALVTGTVVVDVDAPMIDAQPAAGLRLTVADGVARGTSVALPKPGSADPPVVVGRDERCDLVVSDPRVSRRHLKIVAGADDLRFEDLASSNGTVHNGQRRQTGTLREGDRLAVGDTPLVIARAHPSA